MYMYNDQGQIDYRQGRQRFDIDENFIQVVGDTIRNVTDTNITRFSEKYDVVIYHTVFEQIKFMLKRMDNKYRVVMMFIDEELFRCDFENIDDLKVNLEFAHLQGYTTSENKTLYFSNSGINLIDESAKPVRKELLKISPEEFKEIESAIIEATGCHFATRVDRGDNSIYLDFRANGMSCTISHTKTNEYEIKIFFKKEPVYESTYRYKEAFVSDLKEIREYGFRVDNGKTLMQFDDKGAFVVGVGGTPKSKDVENYMTIADRTINFYRDLFAKVIFINTTNIVRKMPNSVDFITDKDNLKINITRLDLRRYRFTLFWYEGEAYSINFSNPEELESSIKNVFHIGIKLNDFFYIAVIRNKCQIIQMDDDKMLKRFNIENIFPKQDIIYIEMSDIMINSFVSALSHSFVKQYQETIKSENNSVTFKLSDDYSIVVGYIDKNVFDGSVWVDSECLLETRFVSFDQFLDRAEQCIITRQDIDNILPIPQDKDTDDFYDYALSQPDQLGISEDEQIEEKPQKFAGVENTKPASVMPNNQITKLRVVSLKVNGKLIAYRFKTNIGEFDMRCEVAINLGLVNFKTDTFINLESYNGVLLSKSERENRKIVPDVSDDMDACRKLVDAIFTLG